MILRHSQELGVPDAVRLPGPVDEAWGAPDGQEGA